MHSRKGFTLIELLVVISIVALLSSVVLSSVNTARARAQKAAAQTFSGQFVRALGAEAAAIWKLDETSGSTASDSTLLGNTGTVSGTATWSADTFSGMGRSFSFNGSTYITGSLPATTFAGDFTITAWFKRTAPSTWGGIFSNNIMAPWQAPLMTMRNATTQFGMNRSGVDENGVYVDLGSDMDGKWIFGVVQRRGNTVTAIAFKDGKMLSSSVTWTPAWTINSQGGFLIGRHYSTNHNFIGLIDEVAVYTEALQISQIERLYEEGAARLFAAR